MSVRWLSGATIAGVALATLAVPAAQAAPPVDGFFCTDGTQPMVTQQEVVDTFNSDAGSETEVTGLTVTKGTTPEGFTGKYIGNIENALGKGRNMLLFRMSGAGIDSGARPAGIWAGMSGSPVYAQDGRLIGAVAYGLNADNLPIAGVTPADFMKSAGAGDLSGSTSVRITRANLEGASTELSKKLAGTKATQLRVPKVASGSDAAVERLNKSLATLPKESRFDPLRAGGYSAGPAQSTMAEPLVPGGNIAVGTSSGDVFMGGVGTVTAICGTTVWAFGHPMGWEGKTSLSMHNASAALVVTDSTGVEGSYKQVSKIGQQIGTITQDRFAAIRGEIGLDRSFPVTATIRDSGGVIDVYNSRIPGQGFSVLAAYTSVTGILDSLDNSGTGTVRQAWKISYKLPGGQAGVVSRSQVYAYSGYLYNVIFADLVDDLEKLSGTDLADLEITSVESTATLVSEDALTYRIAGAQVLVGSTWANLDGRTLKAKKTHKIRPIYRNYVNGKPKSLSVGAAVSFKLGKNAVGPAMVDFAPLVDPDAPAEEEGFQYADLGELFDAIESTPSADRGELTVSWTEKAKKAKKAKNGKKAKKKKAKSVSRTATFTAPGLLERGNSVTFNIRR